MFDTLEFGAECSSAGLAFEMTFWEFQITSPLRGIASTGAPTHEILVLGRWKAARVVEVYTRAEESGGTLK